MQLKCLIIDFGNVLGFFDHGLACRRLADLGGGRKSSNEVHGAVFESGLEEQYDRGDIPTPQFLARLRQLSAAQDASDDDLAAAWSDIFRRNEAVIRMLPGLNDALGLRLVLGSNTNELHQRQFAKQFADALRHFDHQVLSFRVRHRKPDPGFYRCCLEAAGCEPAHCVFIDDRADYVKAARRTGMRGIAYDAATVDLPAALRALGVHCS